jgi:hypothetical protein
MRATVACNHVQLSGLHAANNAPVHVDVAHPIHRAHAGVWLIACTRAGIATASRCAQHNRAECSSGCRYVTACVIAGTSTCRAVSGACSRPLHCRVLAKRTRCACAMYTTLRVSRVWCVWTLVYTSKAKELKH